MTGTDQTVDAAVVALCAATSTPYRLVGRLVGGETGAHESRA